MKKLETKLLTIKSKWKHYLLFNYSHTIRELKWGYDFFFSSSRRLYQYLSTISTFKFK